jgi:Eukaryotic-type carbonic anhydrase
VLAWAASLDGWTGKFIPFGGCPLISRRPRIVAGEQLQRNQLQLIRRVVDDSGHEPIGRGSELVGRNEGQIMTTEQPKVLLTRRELLKTGAAAAVIAVVSLPRPGSTLAAGTTQAPPAGAWNHDPTSPIGPLHWGDIGFPTCGQGMRQSPVDIRTDKVAAYHGAPLFLRYESSELTVENTGHVVEVPIPTGVHDTLQIGGRPLCAGAVPLPRAIRARRQRPAG